MRMVSYTLRTFSVLDPQDQVYTIRKMLTTGRYSGENTFGDW